MKTPVDPTQVASIVERVRKVHEKNNPKGMPPQRENEDKTNIDYPMIGEMPHDRGFQQKDMITGSGNGPLIDAIGE